MVITIIGILISLLLPAVQAAREAARRAQCSNNLKQIGLAVLNYESVRKILPPGAIFIDTSPRTRKGSVLVHILPYMELQAIYDAFDFKQPSIDGQNYKGTTNPIGATKVPAYICPSDNIPNTFDTPPDATFDSIHGVTTVALHSYSASRGSNRLIDNIWESCSCPAGLAYSTTYAVCTWPFEQVTAHTYGPFSGPFTRRGTCVTLAEIKDGLSNTIFFGEVRPLWSWHADNGWATSNNGNGMTSTVIPINYDTNSRATSGNNCGRFCNYNTAEGFKSAHPGGAQFLYGDGSVHFLPESIDHWTYQYLGDKNDGKTPSGNF